MIWMKTMSHPHICYFALKLHTHKSGWSLPMASSHPSSSSNNSLLSRSLLVGLLQLCTATRTSKITIPSRNACEQSQEIWPHPFYSWNSALATGSTLHSIQNLNYLLQFSLWKGTLVSHWSPSILDSNQTITICIGFPVPFVNPQVNAKSLGERFLSYCWLLAALGDVNSHFACETCKYMHPNTHKRKTLLSHIASLISPNLNYA